MRDGAGPKLLVETINRTAEEAKCHAHRVLEDGSGEHVSDFVAIMYCTATLLIAAFGIGGLYYTPDPMVETDGANQPNLSDD
jgi:hypothetical protein